MFLNNNWKNNYLKRYNPLVISQAIFISITLIILSSCTSGKGTTGYYKVGNPYKIADKVYTPKEQPDYDEVGVASWYGSDFHKKETANGGTFDRNSLTAAHRTLPLPSMVRVTNLKNNKTLILMVNDRGPFSKDRIIDVSERAAEVLGFKGAGTTKVRVQYLSGQTKRLLADLPESKKRNLAANTSKNVDDLSATTLKTPVKATAGKKDVIAPLDENKAEPSIDTAVTTEQGDLEKPQPAKKPEEKVEVLSQDVNYVQAGIYSIMENAKRVEKNLGSLGTVNISQVKLNGKLLYKVTIGPILDKKVAELTLKKAIVLGHPDAMLVKEAAQ